MKKLFNWLVDCLFRELGESLHTDVNNNLTEIRVIESKSVITLHDIYRRFSHKSL